jgi:hypothetical protein
MVGMTWRSSVSTVRPSAAIRPSVENALMTSTCALATAVYINDESMLRRSRKARP